jgi:hypothetical protein
MLRKPFIQARYGLGLTEASQNADIKTPLFKYQRGLCSKAKQFEKPFYY